MTVGLIRSKGQALADELAEFALLLGRRIISYDGSGEIEPSPEAYRLAHARKPL